MWTFVAIVVALGAGFGIGRITPSNLKKDLAAAKAELATLKSNVSGSGSITP